MRREMADKEDAGFCSACGKELLETIDIALNVVIKENLIIKKQQPNLSKEAELKVWINLFKKKERKDVGFLNLNLNLTPELPQMLPQIYDQKL